MLAPRQHRARYSASINAAATSGGYRMANGWRMDVDAQAAAKRGSNGKASNGGGRRARHAQRTDQHAAHRASAPLRRCLRGCVGARSVSVA